MYLTGFWFLWNRNGKTDDWGWYCSIRNSAEVCEIDTRCNHYPGPLCRAPRSVQSRQSTDKNQYFICIFSGQSMLSINGNSSYSVVRKRSRILGFDVVMADRDGAISLFHAGSHVHVRQWIIAGRHSETHVALYQANSFIIQFQLLVDLL